MSGRKIGRRPGASAGRSTPKRVWEIEPGAALVAPAGERDKGDGSVQQVSGGRVALRVGVDEPDPARSGRRENMT